VHQQLMARLAFHQPMEVVHPRIVAAHMATADQQQFGRRAAIAGQALQVFEQGLGAASIAWLAVQATRQVGASGPRSRPWG
jgi:hypothetical protein